MPYRYTFPRKSLIDIPSRRKKNREGASLMALIVVPSRKKGASMTGLSPGPAAPILRGYLQNFVFMITSPLSARRLINTKSSTRRRPNLTKYEVEHEGMLVTPRNPAEIATALD